MISFWFLLSFPLVLLTVVSCLPSESDQGYYIVRNGVKTRILRRGEPDKGYYIVRNGVKTRILRRDGLQQLLPRGEKRRSPGLPILNPTKDAEKKSAPRKSRSSRDLTAPSHDSSARAGVRRSQRRRRPVVPGSKVAGTDSPRTGHLPGISQTLPSHSPPPSAGRIRQAPDTVPASRYSTGGSNFHQPSSDHPPERTTSMLQELASHVEGHKYAIEHELHQRRTEGKASSRMEQEITSNSHQNWMSRKDAKLKALASEVESNTADASIPTGKDS